jgi:DNA-binding transcriptional LysR family regulator
MAFAHKQRSDLHNVDLRLLKIFRSVVEHGGFAGAQTEMNVTMSVISGAISALETRLGCRLCNRGRGGFRLTEDGARVYGALTRLNAAIDQFHREATQSDQALGGVLRIGMVDAVATIQPNALIAAFGRLREKAPNVTLTLKIDTPQDLIHALHEEVFDVVIVPVFRRLMGLRVTLIEDDNLQIIHCGAGHPFFGKSDREITFDMIASQPFVARTHMQGWTPPRGLKFNEQASTSDIEAIAALVLSGQYLGYLPEIYSLPWVERGQMWPIKRTQLSYRSRVCAVARKAPPSNLANAFCALIAEAKKG